MERNMDVNIIFKNYRDLQQNHLKILETETLPDLKTMTKERNNAFVDLKKQLENLLETKDPALLKKVENSLAGLMETDNAITLKIQNHRKNLLSRMKTIRQGKKAMDGYRQPQSLTRPAVVNMDR